jgi:hypothetical protein
MRNNSRCDSLCNNKACDYDGGECLRPNSASHVAPASVPDARDAFDLEKFASTSVLRTVQSPVLTAINQHAAIYISQHDERAEKASSVHSRAATDDVLVPTTIKCSQSSVRDMVSFIEARSSEVTVQSDSCTGLASCKSCGRCGLCGPTGCDTSFFDNFCRMKGDNWACAEAVPSASNNFSSTTCVENVKKNTGPSNAGPSVDNQESSERKLSPGAIAGISIAVIVSVALVAAVAIVRLRRRNTGANAPISSIVEMRVELESSELRSPAEGGSS